MNLNLNMKKYLSSLVKGQLNSRTSSVVSCESADSCLGHRLARVSCSPKGFTLLELLIVVSIIAILSVALVLVLDPAETLKKSRDSQRMSDLATMKTAIALYTTSTTTPYIGGLTNNNGCKATPTTEWNSVLAPKIFYSVTTAITHVGLDGATGAGTVASTTSSANYTLTDGTGWIPVNFDSLIGGSPISNLPVDPVNTIEALGAVDNGDYVYRYACSKTPLAFELNAVLESTTYTTGTDNKLTKDGGNSNDYYEVGTNLKILGVGAGTNY